MRSKPVARRLAQGSSDEGEADSKLEDGGDMRGQDQEDEGIDIKEEPGTPELESRDVSRDFLLPPELELRTFGVWARIPIPRGTRFGPFLGKLTSERPSDPQSYWEVRVGDGIRRFMDASGDYNWLKHVKSTKLQEAQNVRSIWAGQIYYETLTPVAAGQELLLPPREPLQLDYLLPCGLGQAGDDRSDRESASQHSGTCDEDREDDAEEDEEASCNVCGKNLSNNDYLDEHLIQIHHYPRNRHRCKQCPRAFSSQQCLGRHVASHNRKYTCENCNTVFTDRSNLQRHIRTSHVGARSHACDECGKTFASSSGLKQHSHIHSSVKPFQCGVCLKAYTQFSNLCRHKRMHEGCRQNVECKCCGQIFSTSNSLAKHKRFCPSGDSRTPPSGAMPHLPPHGSPNSSYLMFPRPSFYPPPTGIPPYPHPAMFPAGPAASFLNTSMINKLNEENLGLKPGSLFMNGKFPQYYPSEDHLISLLKEKADPELMRRSSTPPTSTHPTFGFKASPNIGEEAISKPSPARPVFSGTFSDPKDSLPDPEINVVDIQPEPHDLSTSSEDKQSSSEKAESLDTPNSPKSSEDQPLDLRVKGKRKDGIEVVNDTEQNCSLSDKDESPKKKFKRHVQFDKDDSDDEDDDHSPRRFDSLYKSKCISPAASTNSSVSPRDPQSVRKEEVLRSSPPIPPRSPIEQLVPTLESKVPPMVCPIPIHPHPSIRFESLMYRNHFANFSPPDSNSNHERFMPSQLPQFHPRLLFAQMMNGMAHGQSIHRPPLDMLRPQMPHFAGGNKPFHEVLNPQPDSVNGNKMKDRYSCKFCGKVFPRSANLTRHLRTHTGEQPYKCKYCERCFSISSNLQRHVRNIHNKEKPFKCSLCDRCFGQQTNLDRHLKKHEGDDGSGIVSVADSPGSSNENDGEDACVEIRNFMGRVAYGSMDSLSHSMNFSKPSHFKMPNTPPEHERINSTTNPAEEDDSEITLESDRDSPQEPSIYPYPIIKSCYQDSPLGLVVNKGLDFMMSKDMSSSFDVKLKAEKEESSLNNNISDVGSIHVT